MKKRFLTSCIAVLLLAAMLLPFGSSAQSLANTLTPNEPTLDIAYQNLSFRDNVVIKYAVDLDGVTSAQLLVWTAPESEYLFGTQDDILQTVGTQEIEGSEYYIYDYTKLSAKQMTDEIYVRAHAKVDGKDIYSQVKKFSIVEYATIVKSQASTNVEYAKLVPMLNKMLEFGAEAQKYFNYRLDRLATAAFYFTTVIGGTLSDGTTSGLYPAGTEITLIAPDTNDKDQPFLYWINSFGEEVTVPITTGAFNETYTAVYDERIEQSFKPILRFVVASDTHLANTVSDQDARLAKMFTTAYAYSDSHAKYNKLDGVFVVGDAVDKGTQEAMNRYFGIIEDNLRDETFSFTTLGNHEYYTTKYIQELIDKGGTAIYDETVSWFKAASGYDAVDLHTVIDGYHFIFLSPDGTGWTFSDTKKAWLSAELEAAAADDPTGKKPIFVFQHEPPKDTVLGSAGTNIDLSPIFNSYPQVVDFSGHSHYPINDPRSIWQGLYTALNTGSIKYLSYDIAGIKLDDIANATDYEGGWGFLTDATVIPDGGAYYIVEVSADNAILIKGYDVDGEAFCMKPIYIPSVGDPDEFTYGADREDKDDIPAFSDGSKIDASADNRSITVTFPQANAGAYVNHYRVELLRGSNVAHTRYVLSGTAQCPVPESRTVTLSGLRPDTTYTVKVTPVSSFAVDGSALTVDITTKSLDYTPTELPTPDIFELELSGGAKDGVSGDALTASTNGTPNVVFDRDFGQLAAQFNDAACYKYAGIADEYSNVANSITMELFTKIDKVTGSYDYPFSNFDSGGFGFIAYPDGTFKFGVHVGGAYQYAVGKYTIGELLHAVGTYDGSTVKLYINGELVASKSVSGSFKAPASASHKYLGIGADSGQGQAGDAPITGAIAVANIYKDALTKDQICSLYMDRTDIDYTPKADIFELELNENGTATNKADGTQLLPSNGTVKNGDSTTANAPTVIYDDDFGMLAAQLDGSSGFIYSDMADKYDLMKNSMTIEMMIRVDDITSYRHPISSQSAGGFGFNAVSSSKSIEFSIAYKDSAGATKYLQPKVKNGYEVGEVLYVVGTYDGQTAKLYINGELVNEVSGQVTMATPGVDFLVIGADAYSRNGETYNIERPLNGAISVANIYSYALDADTIANLYNNYN